MKCLAFITTKQTAKLANSIAAQTKALSASNAIQNQKLDALLAASKPKSLLDKR
jgi:hypothetical protein